DYDHLFTVNTKGAFFLVQAALDLNLIPDNGRIISISSIAARRANPSSGMYSGSKAALEAFSRNWAAELGPRGITSNCVCPVPVRSAMWDGVAAGKPGHEEKMGAASLLGRIGEVDDISKVIAFLASPDAKWITGQSIQASGGMVLGL
ncbi:hypothetical protein BDK51DRAFT_21037, partial [Blyttiomyces helicus]